MKQKKKLAIKGTVLIFFAAFSVFSLAGFSQNCNPEEVTSYPGKWKPGMQGSINGVSAASLAKQKEIVANFVKRLQQNMKLEGFNINYSGVYGYPNPTLVKNRKMDAYQVSMAVLPLNCKNGQIAEVHETHYWVNIGVNKITTSNRQSFFVQTSKYEEDPDTDILYQLDQIPIKERSAWLLKEIYTGGFGRTITRYKWIIAYNDELPYRFLTRKEMCHKLIAYFQKISRYSNSETEKVYYQKLIDCAEDYMSKTSVEELNLKAKVSGSMLSIFYQYWDNIPPFQDDADKNGRYVIDIDHNYFKASLPMHTPQIITLVFSIDATKEAELNNMYKMLDALDIDNLKTMLGNPSPFGKSNQPVKKITPGTTSPVPAKKTTEEKQPAPVVKAENKPAAPEIKSKPTPPAPKAEEADFDPSKPVNDLDGNQYTVLKIGNQFWLKENLRTTKYNDTTAIATGLSDEQWKQTKKGAYSIYENNPLHDKTYGKLYNGYAVATGKLCPKGWRIATDKDWKELEEFSGIPATELDRTGGRGNIADKLKTTEGWKASAFSGINSSGFSILPGGSRLENGEFTTLGQYGNFWTSTVYDDRYGLLYLWNHHVHYNTHAVGRIYTLANNGYSCRCILDNNATIKKPK